MLMQLGVDGVFVGSGIFKSSNPVKRARAMVQAVTHYNDAKILAEISEDLGEPMVGILTIYYNTHILNVSVVCEYHCNIYDVCYRLASTVMN